MIISFEGINGSGKSTLSRLVADRLKEEGLNVLYLRYPKEPINFGNKNNKTLVKLFTDQMKADVPAITAHIASGGVVIMSRSIFSTQIYQTEGKEDEKHLRAIVRDSGIPAPNVVILLDGDPEMLASRIPEGEKDKYEKNMDFQKRARAKYLAMFKEKSPNTQWALFDATKPVDRSLHDIMFLMRFYIKHELPE